jgi:hypothetical protein
MNTKAKILNEQEMDSVNGGAWGYHYYKDESTYNKAGIKTDWTYNPFVTDKFYFRDQQIDAMTAARIVFFTRHNEGVTDFSMQDVDNYAKENAAAFKNEKYNVTRSQPNQPPILF